MTETKNIKINLKNFIEDMLIALQSKDEDSINELDDKFYHFYYSQTDKIKDEVLYYLKQTKLVVENDCLVSYLSKFSI